MPSSVASLPPWGPACRRRQGVVGMRWLLLFALTSCGGKMIIDSDAGDAAIVKDSGNDGAVDDGSGPSTFECGEGTHIVHCNIGADYCQLIKTSHSHDYSCDWLPVTCAPPASAKYDCGCYQSGKEIYVTICK